ncbi:MAG: DNA-binding domain-containing protein [Gammaproteobacteria bacterium]
MSTSLTALQNLFQAYLMEGYQDIETHIITAPSDEITVWGRLDIYRNAYYARLVEILGLDYPVLKKILGIKRFEKLGHAYVSQYPSHSFSIRLFGCHFSEFLANQKTAVPAHAEMATLEWALSQAIDALDGPHLIFAELAKIPPESWVEMRLRLHPSIVALPYFYNVTEVWRAVNQNNPKPRWHYQKKPQYCLVWRYQQRSYFMELSEAEYTFYLAIQQGKTFVELCEVLAEYFAEEEIPAFASTTLQKWVSQGLLSETYFATAETT